MRPNITFLALLRGKRAPELSVTAAAALDAVNHSLGAGGRQHLDNFTLQHLIRLIEDDLDPDANITLRGYFLALPGLHLDDDGWRADERAEEAHMRALAPIVQALQEYVAKIGAYG